MGNSLPDKDAVWLPIEALKPWDKNPRKNDGEPVDRVADSIARWGFTNPIVIWRGGDRMVAGHTRLKAMKALLAKDKTFRAKNAPAPGLVRVLFHEFVDEADADLYAMADNRLGELALWDDEAKAEILAKYSHEDVVVAGFDDDVVVGGETVNDPEVVPEAPKVPVTQRGDLYVLGEHRLLCGDAFEEAARARLIGEDASSVEMVFTDPPYGMRLDQRFDRMFANDANHRATGERFRPVIGDDVDFDPRPLLDALRAVKEQFWWGADYYRRHLPDEGSWIVWDKRGNDVGMNLDAVAGSVFELCFSRRAHKRDIARVLWSGHHGMVGADAGVLVHPTQKPIALVSWFFERYGKAGDRVLDLFGGSGSTLIGCEKWGRRARVMELDPNYCDVIVARWEQATGGKAERIPGAAAA